MSQNLPEMDLDVWNLGGEHFNYAELLANFQKINAHDHTPGKGNLIPTAGIANLAITAAKLGDLSVTTGKLGDGAVTDAKLATRIIRGRVGVGGAVVSGSGFTSEHTATGAYTVTFSTPFAAIPVVVAMPTQTYLYVSAFSVSTSSAQLRFRTDAGALEDTTFSFIAISV